MAETNGRATWAVLGVWAGVILTLVFGIGSAVGWHYNQRMGLFERMVVGLQDRELARAFEQGRLAERIDNHGARLVALDEVLQREMRLINDRTLERLGALDIRLQDEIRHAARVGEEDRETIKALVAEMREYQDMARGLNAAQEERLRALERGP